MIYHDLPVKNGDVDLFMLKYQRVSKKKQPFTWTATPSPSTTSRGRWGQTWKFGLWATLISYSSCRRDTSYGPWMKIKLMSCGPFVGVLSAHSQIRINSERRFWRKLPCPNNILHHTTENHTDWVGKSQQNLGVFSQKIGISSECLHRFFWD